MEEVFDSVEATEQAVSLSSKLMEATNTTVGKIGIGAVGIGIGVLVTILAKPVINKLAGVKAKIGEKIAAKKAEKNSKEEE